MTLEERIESLPEQVRLELGIHFLEIGLPIWKKLLTWDEIKTILKNYQ